jgi:predicted aspartyl protease
VTLIGPADSRFREGLLDSGADDTVFPESLAADIGVDLTNAPARQLSTAARTAHPLRYAQVTLRIFDGGERREWPAWVGFTPARLKQPLLGIAGFLQFFDTNLRGALEVAELTVNSSYPGT